MSRVYDLKKWLELRELKLHANPLCEACLKRNRLQPATAVDHIVAVNAGGDWFPPLDGLMSLCASCHNRKSNLVEQQGKALTEKGCDIEGNPLDRSHPWFR